MGIQKSLTELYRRISRWSGELKIFNIKGSNLRLTGFLFLLGLLGVLLIFASNLLLGRPATVNNPPTAVETLGIGRTPAADNFNSNFDSYEKALAAELERILSQIKGAGKVAVSVTLDSGVERVYAQNQTITNRRIEEIDSGGGTRTTTETDENGQMVIVRESQSGNERLVVVKEIKPKISGVIVVSEGAGSSQVKADLTRAVQTVLGIPAVKVQVFAK